MAIRVNTNVSSLISQNSLSRNTKSLEATMKQLATGLKVNNAKTMLPAWQFQKL
ncbi:MAG: hypothetical protein L6V95_14290 [Candidatus Melainabacteria bacterium]|nr:MAG: hypothetical protein L6V95_14290 [Candidatus Melainabacteria bacterium]